MERSERGPRRRPRPGGLNCRVWQAKPACSSTCRQPSRRRRRLRQRRGRSPPATTSPTPTSRSGRPCGIIVTPAERPCASSPPGHATRRAASARDRARTATATQSARRWRRRRSRKAGDGDGVHGAVSVNSVFQRSFRLLLTPVRGGSRPPIADFSTHIAAEVYDRRTGDSGGTQPWIILHQGNQLNPYINYPFLTIEKLRAASPKPTPPAPR